MKRRAVTRGVRSGLCRLKAADPIEKCRHPKSYVVRKDRG
jgi:hypothetical protein